MKALDLMADGFPHGTKEGYAQGCRGGSCIGVMEVGISCSTAQTRYQGDYGFRKRVDAGMSPAEIVAADREEAAAAAEARAAARSEARRSKPKPSPLRSAPVVAPDTRAERAPAKEFPHGTHAGYQRGCRDDACPRGENGLTCREARRAYDRDRKARMRAEKAAAVEVAAVVEPAIVVENHATEPDELDVAVDPINVMDSMAGELGRVRAELAEARERIVALTLELDVAKSARRVKVEPTATGVTVIVNVA